ncbi:hypothetical protein EPYR_00737 [Erwinia pyrifoliae DSM 12163]|nr:hypothetical protein EPYR_00737 [Erwinia pyrifoliae DSM 12163]
MKNKLFFLNGLNTYAVRNLDNIIWVVSGACNEPVSEKTVKK